MEVSRRGDGQVEHYAWLAEVRQRLDDPHEWWTYTNRSGPLMGLWRKGFQRPGHDTFLEFVCSDDQRILCLKLGWKESDLRSAAVRVLDSLEHCGWEAPRRKPSANAVTCTAAWLDFCELDPGAAATRTRQAIDEIETS